MSARNSIFALTFLTLTVVTLGMIGGCESHTFVLGDLGSSASHGGQGGEANMPKPSCLDPGSPCEGSPECCSRACVSGMCAVACQNDEADCDTDEMCCSGACVDGACKPLSATCRTSGNSCTTESECCSNLCLDGRCDVGGSFCVQSSDACLDDAECCSGECSLQLGATWGTCDPPPTGPTNCTGGIAGSPCTNCNDCCSRLCVPYGAHGTNVCALAEGCRQTGELCASDAECCGGEPSSGLPGAGNVTCTMEAGENYGVCRNATSCSPEGNACHIQDYACGVSSAANKCCAADGGEGACVLDAQGVPRCQGLGAECLDLDESCAFDGDCCTGTCRPTDDGLRCAPSAACSDEGESCAASTECCPLLGCARLLGETFGTCEPSGESCAFVGQLCGGAFPQCCSGGACAADGRCALAPAGTANP